MHKIYVVNFIYASKPSVINDYNYQGVWAIAAIPTGSSPSPPSSHPCSSSIPLAASSDFQVSSAHPVLSILPLLSPPVSDPSSALSTAGIQPGHGWYNAVCQYCTAKHIWNGFLWCIFYCFLVPAINTWDKQQFFFSLYLRSHEVFASCFQVRLDFFQRCYMLFKV